MPFNPVTGQWESEVLPNPPAPPPMPQQTPYNPDPQDAIERVRLAQDLRAQGLDTPSIQPNIRPDKGINIGRRNLVKGSTMEAIRPYLALLYKQVADTPLGDQPHQRALGIAARIGVGGYLGAQKAREESNAEAVKSAEQLQKERRDYIGIRAREMAQHRWKLDEERRAAEGRGDATMVDVPGVGKVPATSGIAMRHLESTGVIPKNEPDPLVQQARQSLIDQRDAALIKQQNDEADKAAQDEQYAEDVAAMNPGTSPIIQSGRKPEDARRIINMVNKKLRERGSPYTHQQLLTMWNEKERFYKTMDQQQMVGFRQAAVTASMHLKQFEDFYTKFGNIKPPPNIKTVGKGTYQLAMEGLLGQEAQAAAAALEPIKEALPTEIAKVLAGGRVPYEFEVRKAQHAFIDPFLPKRASKSQVSSTRQILRARIESQTHALPFAGGANNPYLLDVSPIVGWDEGEKAAEPLSQDKPKGGGKAGKYGN